ncbi:LPP20 family lipoprotein [Sulfurospirillum multivorans]|uniref:LPP20 lipoprotein n=2 Tax=Sulfurospirillum multivorans TaxID=66821 RepID=A0AA86DYI5_SULMK|nr:hypothetical protein [Sulfurospirillum multivorans]AHJ11680.1 hypothetical protein SMUL_0398 [Sulfurospirillum multivorans DSM 12446]QEH05180.1 hypothetical protein SMN_0391 [Sulfurospirillum multivorans]
MNKWFVTLLASLGLILVISGCSSKSEPAKDPKAAMYDFSNEKSFVVYGEGIAPKNTVSPAQAIALAKRAAITDGYRQLGEKLYGVKINSTETVQDAALKDSRITAQVSALVKDAAITDATFRDGLYSIRMEITMSARRWHELFAY